MRRALFGCLLGVLVFAPCAHATSANAVEYFSAALDHYFITAEPDEVAALDAGTPPGWVRTGFAFSVGADASSGNYPVCRFFSAAFAPKSSHFYTPSDAECASLKRGTTWSYESIAFYLDLPTVAGTCSQGATKIYRLYNNGQGGAPNHRYTGLRAVVDVMVAQGWIVEGHGDTGVFACGPAPPANASTIVSVRSPVIGVSYRVSIVVPQGHGPDSDPIPVIYALDAQIRIQWLVQAMQETGARAILVAIDDMNRRQTDFNMPGASLFLDYLKHELIPYVEANYRADSRRRVLSGLSTGGNFPFHALYLDAPGPRYTFAHYWSSEGAFWQQAEIVSAEEQSLYDTVGRSPLPVTLAFARGAPSPATNSTIVRALYDQVASRHYDRLRLFDLSYPLGHVEMDAPSFRDELGILLGPLPH